MNNQDFKKLLRESIEARKEKELEEGFFANKLEQLIGKAIDWVDDNAVKTDSRNIDDPSRFKDKEDRTLQVIHVFRKVVKKEAKKQISDFNKDKEEEKQMKKTEKEINYISQVIAMNIFETLKESPNANPKEIQEIAKKEISNWLDIPVKKDDNDSEEENNDDLPSGDGEVEDPNANASDDFLDPKVNAASITKQINRWLRSQIYVLTRSNAGKESKKESIKFIQNLNIILKKDNPEIFKQFLVATFKKHRTRGATKTRSGGSGSWIVNHPGNLDRLSLNNFKKIMEYLLKNTKMKPIFNAVDSLEESKKSLSHSRLHESHQKERDEEIYNKLMKRLNNQ